MSRPVEAIVPDESGSSLALVGLAALVLIALAALAIDLGMLYTARGEAQRVADAAALAGAGGLVVSPGNEDLARALATDYAARNPVRGEPVTLRPEDIAVETPEGRVTVTVHRTDARDNAIPTLLAHVIGFETVDVRTSATAEASASGAVRCLLPLAIPDRWAEVGGDPLTFDPEDGDYYIPWDPDDPDAPYTGYSQEDAGTEVLIKPFKNGKPNPSWYYPWRPPGQQGASDYRTNISGCVDTDAEYFVGQEVTTEPGAMLGPTKQGFEDLIDQDPNAAWNDILECVTDASYQNVADPTKCRSSPRVRPAPMFDPTTTPDPGVQPLTFTNFAGVFVDRIQGNQIYVIFLGYHAVASAGSGTSGGSSGALFRVLRLIE